MVFFGSCGALDPFLGGVFLLSVGEKGTSTKNPAEAREIPADPEYMTLCVTVSSLAKLVLLKTRAFACS